MRMLLCRGERVRVHVLTHLFDLQFPDGGVGAPLQRSQAAL